MASSRVLSDNCEPDGVPHSATQMPRKLMCKCPMQDSAITVRFLLREDEGT